MTALLPFNGKLLAADEKPKVLEGRWDRDKLVLISFADERNFHAWSESAVYQDILRDRKAGADAIVLLTKGLPATFSRSRRK